MKAGGTSRQDAFAQLKGGSGDRRCQRKGRTWDPGAQGCFLPRLPRVS